LSGVQFEFFFKPSQTQPPRAAPDSLVVASQAVPLWFCRNRRARRYILRVQPDGSARVTIPRGGSLAEARSFAEKHTAWVEKQLEKRQARPSLAAEWRAGTAILFRGIPTVIEASLDGHGVRVGEQLIRLDVLAGDLRPALERHFWRLAASELAARTTDLASIHQVAVHRVSVRNQRGRWGSCSVKGTISLNWRLIQTPPWVSDYIIIHELMHRREMNHSRRFWRCVEQACPRSQEAEKWLKDHADLLEQRRGREG
jgi:predicted metal-dependent hydrolase